MHEPTVPFSICALRGSPSASKCLWPTYSSSEEGRILAASGTQDGASVALIASKRSSGMLDFNMTYKSYKTYTTFHFALGLTFVRRTNFRLPFEGPAAFFF